MTHLTCVINNLLVVYMCENSKINGSIKIKNENCNDEEKLTKAHMVARGCMKRDDKYIYADYSDVIEEISRIYFNNGEEKVQNTL